MKISACLITFNEEKNLPRCLKSLAGLTDEIVIVDSGSTDRTKEIASQFQARFIEKNWEGYVAQKNFAIAQAKFPWILSLDADEEISPELALNIQQLHNNPEAEKVSGYLFSRLVYYQKKWIRHGDWYPDRLVRLFKKERARFAGGKVHERLEIEGETQLLRGDLFHYTYENRQDREKRIFQYAQLWAESADARGKKAWPGSASLHALVRFLRGYFLKLGFLDGLVGFEIALGNAQEVYLKYSYLLERRGKTDGQP